MLFALDARQFFSPCVYLDDGNENAFGGCFPARRVFSALVQKATASLSELIVSSAWAASIVGPRSTLPHRQTAMGTPGKRFLRRRTEYRTTAKLWRPR